MPLSNQKLSTMKNFKFLSILMLLCAMMSCEPTDLEQDDLDPTVFSDTGDQRDVVVTEKEDND